jgi:hypothetical protein
MEKKNSKLDDFDFGNQCFVCKGIQNTILLGGAFYYLRQARQQWGALTNYKRVLYLIPPAFFLLISGFNVKLAQHIYHQQAYHYEDFSSFTKRQIIQFTLRKSSKFKKEH